MTDTTIATEYAEIRELLRIGNRRVDTPERFEILDPATSQVVGSCPNAAAADVIAAIDAAEEAFVAWKRTAPDARARLLRKVHDALLQEQDELARLITLEVGKPLRESRAEVEYAAEFGLWYAEEARRIYGRTALGGSDAKTWMHLVRQPLGVVGAITPWNYPLLLAARKVFAALAAGCTVILKPSELAPLSALRLGYVAERAGLPDGVLNIVTANPPDHVGDVLSGDPRVRKISFTGSIGTGKQLMEASARNLTRVSLELGGNNPFLVFEDADLEAAVDAALVAKLRNGGQTCVCANRLLVHESVLDEFTRLFSAAMRNQVVGPGLEPTTDVGPLVQPGAASRIQSAVDDAVSAGATLVCGGLPLAREDLSGGSFYPPTVLRDVPPDTRLVTEETFGPVAPIEPISNIDEAVESANRTDYGLAVYVFTESLRKALRVSEDLETGIVVVNRAAPSGVHFPQGGVKQSGIGLEGGPEGLEEFTFSKYISINA
ncbi:MAG: aldehyde dehydrogenase family protein [Pseudonocardiaceae bacterium]|nr:aldehyde dehydrogenase family protein [Pseudonocardiaceae bacterium]